jgi:hypothetical protein
VKPSLLNRLAQAGRESGIFSRNEISFAWQLTRS